MAEYIDKAKLQEALHEAHAIKLDGQFLIHEFPPEDVAPVRRGEWVEIGHETECPFCGEPTGLMTPYCSQCGAKLDRPKR